MGNPTFYYYPDPDAGVVTVDLGEGLSDLIETPITDARDARGMDWIASRVVLGGGLAIRIGLERFGGPATSSLERQLRTLESHLQRGGLCGFSRDSAKAWASVADVQQTSGGSTWTGLTGSLFKSFSSAAALASGDEIVIETAAPEHQREYNTAGAAVAVGDTTVTLGTALRYTFGPGSILRWRDFWPVLRLPADGLSRTFIGNDHRRNFTLDITLEYAPAYVAGGIDGGIVSRGGAPPLGLYSDLGLSDSGGGGNSLDVVAGGRSPAVGKLGGL